MGKPYSASAGSSPDLDDDDDDDTFGDRMPARDAKGRFQAGISGNPAGRPKTLTEVVELARDFTVESVETMVWIMRHEKKSSAVRARAAEWLVARAWGEPTKPITLGNADGETKLELQFVLMPPKESDKA